MNNVRSTLFSVILVISISPLVMGGEIQFPGRTNASSPPPPAPTASSKDRLTTPTQADEIEIDLQDLAVAMLRQLLLTIY